MNEIIEGYTKEKLLIIDKISRMPDLGCLLYDDYKARLKEIDNVLITLSKLK